MQLVASPDVSPAAADLTIRLTASDIYTIYAKFQSRTVILVAILRFNR
jgi:hypothetical protein